MEPKERRAFEDEKRANTLQVLLKVARLVNERAIERVNTEAGRLAFRPALANLLPHIALEGTRVTELSRKLGITKQAVSKLVRELEGEGIVELAADPSDARARLVRFTPAGMKALRHGLGVFLVLEKELAGAVGEGRMRALRATLIALLGRLERPR